MDLRNGPTIPSLNADSLAHAKRERKIQVAALILQLTPASVIIIDDKIVRDDIYHARQAAAKVLEECLNVEG